MERQAEIHNRLEQLRICITTIASHWKIETFSNIWVKNSKQFVKLFHNVFFQVSRNFRGKRRKRKSCTAPTGSPSTAPWRSWPAARTRSQVQQVVAIIFLLVWLEKIVESLCRDTIKLVESSTSLCDLYRWYYFRTLTVTCLLFFETEKFWLVTNPQQLLKSHLKFRICSLFSCKVKFEPMLRHFTIPYYIIKF